MSISGIVTNKYTCELGVGTFLCSFTEDGVMFGEGKQSDIFVVDDVLRVLEAIVGTQEVISGSFISHEVLIKGQNDVEDLCRPFIVVRQASFAQFPSCTVELPVDTLDCDEHQPQQLVEKRRHKTLSQQPVARQSHCYKLCHEISIG